MNQKKTVRNALKPDKSNHNHPPVSTRPVNPALLQQTIANPALASSEGIINLQRTVGNRAVQGWLSQDWPGGSIQRFSEDSLQTDNPINWQAETTSVTKSEEGLSGGVFFSRATMVNWWLNLKKPGQTLSKLNLPINF